MATSNLTPTPHAKKPLSFMSRILTSLWIGVLGCIAATIAIYFLVIRGIVGEPATLSTSEKITAEFVSALSSGDIHIAYSMLADQAQARSTPDDVEALSRQLAQAETPNVRMCEFQMGFGSGGKELTGAGLLRLPQGLVVIQSTLLQGADGSWKVLSFQLRPDVEPKPWGACQFDPP